DAQLAARADAVLLDDLRQRQFASRERPADVAGLVENRLRRADRAAGAAVDADLGVDDVDFVAETGDRLDRALLHTGRAADTGLDDLVGQSSTFRWMGSSHARSKRVRSGP